MMSVSNNEHVTKKIVVVRNTKSVGLAVLLTILFGPLGLLYSSIKGAVILSLLFAVLWILTIFIGGAGAALTYPIAIIWSYFATKRYNDRLLADADID